MDLNAKVEQLVKITTDLKNEVDALKSKDLNSTTDELMMEEEALKDDIVDLKHTLMKQSEHILSLIRQQNDKLVQTIEADKLSTQLAFNRKVSEYSFSFPIKSLQELDKLEKLINKNNLNELIAIVRQLIQPKGIIKNISLVMAVPCIMDCNVDGHHNKRRLLNSPKFMDLVYRSAYDMGCSQKTFLNDFRRGFKMVKNRYNKNLCRHRQMQRIREKQSSKEEPYVSESNEETNISDDLKLEETEKIYLY